MWSSEDPINEEVAFSFKEKEKKKEKKNWLFKINKENPIPTIVSRVYMLIF